MTTDSRMPKVSQRLNERSRLALERHAAEEAAVEQRLSTLDQSGPSALERLAEVAQGHSGQSRHCRRILLAIYNGPEWPLELTRLRCLDRDLQRAALTVIEWSAYSGHELHESLGDGEALMRRFWHAESDKGGES
ncbi:hypothetical protein R5R73_01715 [Salinicola sp. LHM]|uniref:DUF7673 family protein n=1 Tax=Halomonadaceae TaxID=28256 RepID=UPI000690AF73|nr:MULTISPECIES: hypothetical protein [Halomonadaceae]MDF9434680.1 hypothetical protein [Chromohalobacter israelensis]WQH33434.1 hypothetical protein R5R73_01715 [Salinicola sp. LHM]